jgi:hypothetical protein
MSEALLKISNIQSLWIKMDRGQLTYFHFVDFAVIIEQ